MPKLSIAQGTTSKSQIVYIQDTSKIDGGGLAGLVFNSTGLSGYYVRDISDNVQIGLVTQTTTGVWASGGFCAINNTAMPGFYRLDIPNAALATGSCCLSINLQGATNMAQCPIEIELTRTDNQDPIRGGLTVLPSSVNFAEPASWPATPTFHEAIMLLYMGLRNASTATATQRTIKNDAGTTVVSGTMSDDSTTFNQGKLG